MKKINLKGISEILSEKELKNVMGGSSMSSVDDDCGKGCSKDSDCTRGCTHCVMLESWRYAKYCMSQT